MPQLVPIIRYLDENVRARYTDSSVYIIDENDRVHMAHIDIHYGFSVNGVAKLHTEILMQEELKSFTAFILKNLTIKPTALRSEGGYCTAIRHWPPILKN